MTAPKNKGRGRGIAWLKAHVGYQGDDCLPWPFMRDGRVGRGRLGHEGKLWWAHRLMCTLAHGEPPTPKHQAAHNCGKGHYGCVNPRHLEWKTNSENQIDRRKNGNMLRNNRGVRGNLTREQQQTIIALRGQKTQMEIAKQFGVSLGCVQYWHKWRAVRGHDAGKIHVWSKADDDLIARELRAGGTYETIAAKIGVGPGAVRARVKRAGIRLAA